MQCDADADVCNRKSPFSTTKIESFFPVGVEDMQVIRGSAFFFYRILGGARPRVRERERKRERVCVRE